MTHQKKNPMYWWQSETTVKSAVTCSWPLHCAYKCLHDNTRATVFGVLHLSFHLNWPNGYQYTFYVCLHIEIVFVINKREQKNHYQQSHKKQYISFTYFYFYFFFGLYTLGVHYTHRTAKCLLYLGLYYMHLYWWLQFYLSWSLLVDYNNYMDDIDRSLHSRFVEMINKKRGRERNECDCRQQGSINHHTLHSTIYLFFPLFFPHFFFILRSRFSSKIQVVMITRCHCYHFSTLKLMEIKKSWQSMCVCVCVCLGVL